MTDFAHLHVASGFSLRHGASTLQALVERAAARGQPALALTDRDGLYGAVRFATAAIAAGVLPVLGVDLAVGPDRGRCARRRGSARRSAAARSSTRATPLVTVLARAGERHTCWCGWAACAGWSPTPISPVSAAPRCPPCPHRPLGDPIGR